ncbi:MAG: MalY/PatB family protein [Bacillota bacterium]
MADLFKTLKRINTDSIKWAMAKEETGSEDTLTFSVADSDYETAPEIKEALKERVEHGAFGYARADKAYYEVVKDWMLRRYNIEVDKKTIAPIPKVLTALSILLQTLSEKGDGVVIQTPVYHAFRPVIEDNDRTIVDNPLIKDAHTNRYIMDLGHLEESFKNGAKVMVLCSPHNPAGRVWTYHEIRDLVKLCKEYDVPLLSDEIHADIIMKNKTFTSAARFFELYDKIVVLNAPSKTFNIAGLQSGNMVIENDALRTTVKKAFKAIHMSMPNILSMKALKAAYTECDYWVDGQNAHILENYNALKTRLEERFEGIRFTPLEGTYLAWIDIGFTGLDSVTFKRRLAKEKHMVVAEGAKFKDGTNSHIRFNLACSKAMLEDGITRLIEFIESIKKEA